MIAIKQCMFCKERSAVHYYNKHIFCCNRCMHKGAELIKKLKERKLERSLTNG